MGQEGPWSGPYFENNKLMITFFPKPDFRKFLICVINGSGVSFGQIANLLEFIPHYMTALPVYKCLVSKLLIILNDRKHLLAYPFGYDLWFPLYRLW